MLTELIQDRIRFAKKAENWRDAIAMAAEPLLKEGYIEQSYIDGMIQNVEQNGTYIIIVPGFAMPHTHAEKGVVKTGMAYLRLEEPVDFPEDQKVQVLLTVAATDPNAHLDAIAELTEVLMDDERLEGLFHCTDAGQVRKIITV